MQSKLTSIVFFLLVCISFFAVPNSSWTKDEVIFRVSDPHGDDHGDGTIVYPVEHYGLVPGSLDLVSFAARPDKEGTLFEAIFARNIRVPDATAIDAGGQTLSQLARYGFYTFNIDVYVDTDGSPGSGYTFMLPGRNAEIAPQYAWEKAICLTPRPQDAKGILEGLLRKSGEDAIVAKKGRLDPDDALSVRARVLKDLETRYFFPTRVRVSGPIITFFVPNSFTGGVAKNNWSYVVAVSGCYLQPRLNLSAFVEGKKPAPDLMILPVIPGTSPYTFGSTRLQGVRLLPPLIDIIVPAGQKQEDLLRNYSDTENRMAQVPAGWPETGVPPLTAQTAPAQAPATATTTIAPSATQAPPQQTPPVQAEPVQTQQPAAPVVTPAPPQVANPAVAPLRQVVPNIAERLKQFPRTVIDYDRTLLDVNETQVVMKLIEASQPVDEIYWRQVSEDNPKVRAELFRDAAISPKIQMGLEYFDLMKGRWDRLKENEPFISPFGEAGKKPLGAGFYPTDMTKEEFDRWIQDHPNDKASFQDWVTVIRRQDNKLVAIPYSKYYSEWLTNAASKLKEAAAMTSNASLKDYLTKRANAFLSNNYYESDVSWVLMDSPIEVVIGPYEVYEDELFNYKASFESFVTVVDKTESERLKLYIQHLPDMEKNLPIPDIHKNFTRGTGSSIKVVQEIYTSGDGRRGVQTAAFNLPNDEKVRTEKGFKNIIIKNVMEAKYHQTGEPIAKRIWDPSQISMVSFDAYFNHTLFHELSHGLGPGFIMGPDGKKVENRILLKETYSTIEEAKADALGVWNLLYAIDNKWVTTFDANALLVTNAALLFRSMRFGIGEAHGRGTAIQWNWYREKGGIVPIGNGQFKVDFEKSREAVRSLSNELLMIEASGDYDRSQRLLNQYGKNTPEIETVTAGLKDIPVDISPIFAAAGEK